MCDQRGDVEDQVLGGPVLLEVAIEVGLDGAPLGEVCGVQVGLDPRPEGAERVEPLAAGPGRILLLEVTRGDVVQDGSTADLIFDIPTLIAAVSSVMTLLPGDVILTGTPEGVGPMQVGDEVEVAVEGLGSLANTVAKR